jgi:hypothetical protein
VKLRTSGGGMQSMFLTRADAMLFKEKDTVSTASRQKSLLENILFKSQREHDSNCFRGQS